MKSHLLVVLVAAGAAVPGATSPATAASSTATVVKATLNPALKTVILVDARGRTLYLVSSERRNTPGCVDACAKLWPPLLTTAAPKAGAGAKQALLGTAKRPDGKTQVTYAGHPLYYWAGGSGNGSGDRKPGDVEGQARFDVWWAVSPAGTAVKKRL